MVKINIKLLEPILNITYDWHGQEAVDCQLNNKFRLLLMREFLQQGTDIELLDIYQRAVSVEEERDLLQLIDAFYNMSESLIDMPYLNSQDALEELAAFLAELIKTRHKTCSCTLILECQRFELRSPRLNGEGAVW